jgi:hypothetical protein
VNSWVSLIDCAVREIDDKMVAEKETLTEEEFANMVDKALTAVFEENP